MDERRHSVDLPISRTLVALRRVRSLRDPSTNSMSKLSALVDNLNWETKSSNAITLGFDDGGNEGSNDNNGLDGRSFRQEMVCGRKEWREGESKEVGEEALGINSKIPSTDFVESGGSFNQPKRRLVQRGKRFCGRSKHKSWNRKHNRRSRVTADDALSPVFSPCLSASDLSSCWSRTPRLWLANIQTDMEERPFLLTDETTSCQHDSEGITPYSQTPRSLCQKFMPKSFKELVGQKVVAKSLLSAICNGRIASLYLFHGPHGIGKTSAARLFAAALNCLSHEIDKPCGLCEECVSFFSGRSRDVKEVDSVAINNVNRLRSLTNNAHIPPVCSRFKVFIVDECQSFQRETWAAILDKIEELPRNVVFILVTSDLDKMPSIAVSKCQRYNFQTVKVAEISDRLRVICEEEGLDFDEDALDFIAKKSNGSVRDAEMMFDQMSLLSKKITMRLVYEVNGVVSDAELLDLLRLALSSDASNTIKMARELTRTRIDPLQLVSQLANLIMDILSGKCEGLSEIKKKLFGPCNSEADMQQLGHALKILSETEKQLRTSKNQTTWLTVALLQLSSAGVSHDTLNLQDADFRSSSTSECWKHPVASSCSNVVQDDIETLELIWIRATKICKSSCLKNFLQKRGKLVSINLTQGLAVAEIEFDHSNHASKAEKSWKEIAGALQLVLGYNVELRINPSKNSSKKCEKSRRHSFSLFSCSSRLHLRSRFCAECGSNVSEYSECTPTKFLTRDRYVETCSCDCGSEILHGCCHGGEMVTSIRNSDGNALRIGVKTPRRSSLDGLERKNELGADSHCDDLTNMFTNTLNFKTESKSRWRERWKLYCWKTAMFPFLKA